jgi:acyl-CoA thioesterase I
MPFFLALAFLLWVAASPKPAPHLLILGDSLTEGYGVESDQAFPAVLDSLLRAKIPGAKVVGGGVSGSTSASALARLKWYARTKPDWVMLSLGSNDGLRGVPIAATQRQLDTAIRFCQGQGWKVILAGLKVPPNYGPAYAKAFTAVFDTLALRYHLPYYPFLLDGVAGESEMNQEDGLHPNVRGHALIANRLLEFLLKIPNFGK